MGKFDRNRGGFGGSRFGGRDRGPRRSGGFGGSSNGGMHKAICAECGDECQVPFRPTGDRPVLCSTCFKGPGHNEPRRDDRRSFDRPRFEEKQMFDAVCSECGSDCQVPFRPTQGKDVLCSDCFGNKEKGGDLKIFDKSSKGNNGNRSDYEKQFEALNVKINKILELLSPTAKAEAIEAVKEVYAGKKAEKAEKVVEEVKEEKEEVAEEVEKKAKKAVKKVAKKAEKKEEKAPAKKKATKKK